MVYEKNIHLWFISSPRDFHVSTWTIRSLSVYGALRFTTWKVSHLHHLDSFPGPGVRWTHGRSEHCDHLWRWKTLGFSEKLSLQNTTKQLLAPLKFTERATFFVFLVTDEFNQDFNLLCWKCFVDLWLASKLLGKHLEIFNMLFCSKCAELHKKASQPMADHGTPLSGRHLFWSIHSPPMNQFWPELFV